MAIEFDNEMNENVEEQPVCEVVESKPTFVDGLKKYGKKIALGAVVVAVGIIGYIAGKNSTAGDWDDPCDDSEITNEPDNNNEQN